MKKFYLLMATALIAGSASAVEKQTAVNPNSQLQVKAVKNVAAPEMKVAQKALVSAKVKEGSKAASKADQYAYFLPAPNILAIGSSTNGYGLINGFGFVSPYGDLVFNNFSTGVAEHHWNFAQLNGYDVVDDEAVWNIETSEEENLVIKSGVGELISPTLSVTFDDGTQATHTVRASYYLAGAYPDYWFGQDSEGGSFGVTCYQNSGWKAEDKYSGFNAYKNSYQPGANGFNANGVYVTGFNNWADVFQSNFPESEISNLRMENITLIQPKPISTYYMTSGWGWFNINARNATMLTSYIYPVDEDGVISDTAIAIGYATVPKGQSSQLYFEYFALNEDGDEVEGMIFIDSSVAITIEDFSGNNDIISLGVVSGYYPISWEAYSGGNRGIIPETDLWFTFSAEVDGETESAMMYNSGLYFITDDDEDTLTLSYAQFNIDATFPWILLENGEESITLPLTGGTQDLVVNALYYDINDCLSDELYAVNAPDWVTVSFGESDRQTGNTTMTISVEASTENRVGEVSLEGLGVGFTLKVVQGDESGVNEIEAVKAGAVYYDLQGRKLNNAPEKGIYILKEGSKVSKVIR